MTKDRWRRLSDANKAWMKSTAYGCANSKPPMQFDAEKCKRLLEAYWKIVDEDK